MDGSWSSPELPPGSSRPTAAQPQVAGAQLENADGWAVRRPLGRCWWSAVLSFGIWTVYWFHTYRKLLDAEVGRGRDDAILHTFGLFVPGLNYFIVYWLYRDLNELRSRVGLPPFAVGGYVVAAIFVSPVAYSLANQRLNEYWDVRSQGHVRDAPVTTGEKAVIGVGLAFLAFYILFFVVSIALAIYGAGTS